MLVSSGFFCSSSWKFNFKNSSSASLEGALTYSSASLRLEGSEGEEEEGEEEGGEGRGRKEGEGRGREGGEGKEWGRRRGGGEKREGKSSVQTQWRGSFSTGEFQTHSHRLTASCSELPIRLPAHPHR